MLRPLSRAVCFLVVTSFCRAAFAQPEEQSHLALAQPLVPEGLPASAIRQIVVRIAEGLVEGGLDVSVDPFPAGDCVDAPCLRDMARAHGAAAVIVTRITAQGQNYGVKVTLVDGATGHPVNEYELPCNFCAYDELGVTALGVVRELLRRQRERQEQALAPLRLVSRPERRRPTGAALAAIGLGVAAAAGGAVLLALEGDGQARWPSVATIAAGTLLIGGGSALLVFWPTPDPRGRAVGVGVAVRGSF